LSLGTHQGLRGEGSGWLSPKANRALGEDDGTMDKEKLVYVERIRLQPAFVAFMPTHCAKMHEVGTMSRSVTIDVQTGRRRGVYSVLL
jgi:hypothetical protein